MSTKQKKKSENDIFFDTKFWIGIGIFLILVILICFFPYWLTSDSIFDRNFTNTGPIGDTIGGIMGPFIAIIASGLTFIAFWAQYKANLKQTEQFNIQADDVKIERFESKFYEMIKIHRDNITEISISKGTIVKRKAFISMFLELKCAYYVLKKLNDSGKIDKIEKEEDIINIAYIAFFTGVGDNSNKVAKYLLERYNQGMIDIYLNELLKLKEYFNEEIQILDPPNNFGNFSSTFEKRKRITVNYNNISINFMSYPPFNGHMSRLGHYYRHLFQTVKFVVNNEFSKVKKENKTIKYNYLKTLRAQLSDYEMLLLYYNSLSDLGSAWIEENYFTDWKFIKNIPLPLADFGITPIEKLGDFNSPFVTE